MLAYKIPLTISAGVLGAYAIPPSTNEVLLLVQAVFGICVCFALFLLVLHAAEQRGNARDHARRSKTFAVTRRRRAVRAHKPRHGIPR